LTCFSGFRNAVFVQGDITDTRDDDRHTPYVQDPAGKIYCETSVPDTYHLSGGDGKLFQLENHIQEKKEDIKKDEPENDAKYPHMTIDKFSYLTIQGPDNPKYYFDEKFEIVKTKKPLGEGSWGKRLESNFLIHTNSLSTAPPLLFLSGVQ